MSDNQQNMKKQIVSGLIWKFLERILAQGVSFIVSVILARMLSPDDYGIVAIILIFISLANVFVTSGFSTALVQNKKAKNVDFSTNFYCSLTISILIYIIIFTTSPFIADFYNNEQLCLVLRVFALRIPLSAFSAIQHAYVERNMLFKKYFFSTLFGTIVSGIVGIILAYMGYGVWALVFQYLTNTFIDIVVLLITVPWKPTLEFSFKSAKSMMNFGWKIFVADFAGTFFEQLRSIIIGKVYTSADLAFYNKGNQLPTLITSNVGSSIMSVLFPAMANINDKIINVKNMTRKAVRVMSFIMFPLLFGLAAVAKTLVIFLFTEKWIMAVPYVRILSIAYAVSFIGTVSLQAIKAIGRSDTLLKLEFIKKPIYLLLLIIGMKINVIAVAVTMAIYNIYGTIINASALKKTLGYNYKEQVSDFISPLLMSTIMFICVMLLQDLNINRLVLLIIQVIVGIICYTGIAVITKQDTINDLKSILKRNEKMKSKFDYYIIRFKSSIVGLFKPRINTKKIVVDNFLGKGYGDNPKYIVEYLHKLDDSFEFVWIVKNNKIEMPDYIKKVKYGTFSSMFEYLTAKLWIDNVRNNIKPKKRNNQIYLQTWHGPFSSKKIEKLAENSLTKEYVKLAKKDGNQSDAILSNSKLQDEQYLNYFWLNKNTEILKYGFPRNDYLINNKNNVVLFNEIKEKLNLNKDSMLILYAPTFRDDFDVECYKLDFKKIQNEFSEKYKKTCKILVRLHPNVQKYSNFIKYDDNIIDVTKYPNMQDLSLICDVIISDYSSTLFDFAIQNKPAFICDLDLKKYTEKRGLVDEYFKYPFPISLNSDELIKNIKSFNYDDYKIDLINFFNENPLYDNGDATCKIVEWILNKIGGIR